MKKTFALIPVVVIALSAFAFYHGYLLLPGRKPIADAPGRASTPPETVQQPPIAQTPPPTGSTPGNPAPGTTPSGSGSGTSGSGSVTAPAKTVHSILGRSKNLTAQQWAAMLDWREYATAFAGDHAGVYVNGWPKGKLLLHR